MKKSTIITTGIITSIATTYLVIHMNNIICKVIGHQWENISPYRRYCKRCNQHQRLIGYSATKGLIWKKEKKI